MSPRPESAAAAESFSATPEAAAKLQLASSTAEAVERILAYTEPVVAAIASRTEQQAREVAAEAEARMAGEAMEKRKQLVELRRELAEKASALASHYGEIVDRLEAVEAILARQTNAPPARGQPGAESDPRVRAIKMTLRERQRVSFAYEQEPGSPVETAPLEQVPAVGRAPWVESGLAADRAAAPMKGPAFGQAPAHPVRSELEPLSGTNADRPHAASASGALAKPPPQPRAPVGTGGRRRSWWRRWAA